MAPGVKPGMDIVTGAFSFTGKYVARRLLARGRRVRTITGHPNRPDPFGGRVEAVPYAFDDPALLTESLKGGETLYNTYWVRFPRDGVTFERAVENTLALVRAAREAGVRRVVHISIANAVADSPIPYYRWKGILEREIAASGLPHAFIRPTVIFGEEDIIFNNIAWLLRRFPFFAVPGPGNCRIQPVYVDDVAELAIDAGQVEGNLALDAAGPETFTFDGLVRLLARTVGSRTRILHLEPRTALSLTRVINRMVDDVLLTDDELTALMDDLLVSGAPPLGRTGFSDWLARNADRVGREYHSEIGRHYRPHG